MLPLTKSDFLEFRDCSKAFWLKRHRPEAIDWRVPSAFDRLLMKDGYAVEAEARRWVATWPDATDCEFQVEFCHDGRLLARVDLLRRLADGRVDLFEIKSSTGPKDHIEDICFQRVVVERCGTVVRSVHIMHVNKDYVRLGEIDCSQLLTIVDATADALAKWGEIEAAIGEALDLLDSVEIDEAGCSCRLLGNSDNHCAAFAHFNRDLPEISAHVLPRISRQRLAKLDEEGRLGIHALTEADLTAAQLPAWTAITTGQPVVNRAALRGFLDKLIWPLHFYDYETYKPAIPLADGHRPHQQIPVQFSLHRLHEDGRLEHFEFLCDAPGKSGEMAERLFESIAAEGTALVWFETFEKTCNKTLAALHPELADFFAALSERTVDLMVRFQKDYVHPDFRGSTSIKRVLPVVCDLSYDGMPIHDGTGAMEAWATMVAELDDAARDEKRKALLAYCELDTFAMVRVFEFLCEQVAS
jgi:hypothetical protein